MYRPKPYQRRLMQAGNLPPPYWQSPKHTQYYSRNLEPWFTHQRKNSYSWRGSSPQYRPQGYQMKWYSKPRFCSRQTQTMKSGPTFHHSKLDMNDKYQHTPVCRKHYMINNRYNHTPVSRKLDINAETRKRKRENTSQGPPSKKPRLLKEEQVNPEQRSLQHLPITKEEAEGEEDMDFDEEDMDFDEEPVMEMIL